MRSLASFGIGIVPVAVVGSLLLVGCASFQERVATLEDRTAELERRLGDIEARQQEVLSRLDAIRREMATGLDPLRQQQADRGEDVRALQGQATALEDRLRLLDERITQLTEQLAAQRRAAERPPEGRARPSTGESPGPGSPMPLPRGARSPEADSGTADDARRPGATVPPRGTDPPPSEPSEPGPEDGASGPEALYRTAYGDYLKGNYRLAIAAFQQYLDRYPRSDRADNALYWIGESQYAQGDYLAARQAFQEIVEGQPGSDVVAGAMLKGALALLELDQQPAAAAELRRLVESHPTEEESRIACLQLARLGEALPAGCSPGSSSR